MIVPGVKWEPVVSHSGTMNAHMGLVLHVQEGNGDPLPWFSSPANQASSTWWVAKNGTLVQYVDSDLIAWAQASYNGVYNSVETEGYATEPLTDAQVLTLARLYVWGHNVYGWPLSVIDTPGLHGFITHGDLGVPGGGHTGCPGDLRKAQRSAVMYLANLVINPKPVPSLPKPLGVQMIARSADNKGGYWIIKPDGSVWSYGAGYYGGLNAGAPVGGGAMKGAGEVAIAIESSPTGKGYAILSSAYNLFCFGDFQYQGHP